MRISIEKGVVENRAGYEEGEEVEVGGGKRRSQKRKEEAEEENKGGEIEWELRG